MSPRADLRPVARRRGLSTFEMMISVAISSLIFIALGATMIMVTKGLVVSSDQARRQREASRALDAVASIVRNAEFPVTFTSDTDLRFEDVRHPGDTGRIWLDGTAVRYRSDMDDSSTERVLGDPVAAIAFTPDDDPLIGGSAVQVTVDYTYRSLRDYDPERSRAARFVTSVFMRNVD